VRFACLGKALFLYPSDEKIMLRKFLQKNITLGIMISKIGLNV
jgi:hypothetical protein